MDRRWISIALPALLVCAWIAWGFPLSEDIVNPVTTLVTEADLRALEWVEKNTPEDARFFINTTHWLGGVYRGVVGGGWLLPFTGRWSLVPPVFYGFSEDTDYRNKIRDWGERASGISGCSEEFWDLVGEAELGWVYINLSDGALQPEDLVNCPVIVQVYVNERVRIYSTQP